MIVWNNSVDIVDPTFKGAFKFQKPPEINVPLVKYNFKTLEYISYTLH